VKNHGKNKVQPKVRNYPKKDNDKQDNAEDRNRQYQNVIGKTIGIGFRRIQRNRTVTIQAQEKGTPKKAAFKPLKIFLEFFLKVEV
jgi:hypothetical protein